MEQSSLSKSQIQQKSPREITGVQYSYSGPLPPPEILEHYDRIVPHGAERIFAQFESQSAHRRKVESQIVNSDVFVQVFGAVSALLLGILALGGGLFLVHEGKSVEGFGAFFAGLASLVGVYIYGKKSQASERKEKQES